jgi:predicted Rossmann-fold nucleotide-binding protein
VSLDFHYFYARKVMFVKYASAFICFPGGYGTLDECFETLTLIQTLKIEPFPVILFGTEHWTGLVEWIRKSLVPKFIDAGDMDIFRIVDRPEDAVAIVEEAQTKHWWKPADRKLKAIAEGAQKKSGTIPRGPMTGPDGISFEGTRYGRRPKRSKLKHAARGKKSPS